MPTIANLPWLPPPPADFAEQCASAAAGAVPGAQVQRLATHALDARQARRLGRTITRLIEAGADLSPLSGFRLVALSNGTFDFIADQMQAAAARHGVALELVLPPYDQAMQQALDPTSLTSKAGADGILLAFDLAWYGLGRAALGDPACWGAGPYTVDAAQAQTRTRRPCVTRKDVAGAGRLRGQVRGCGTGCSGTRRASPPPPTAPSTCATVRPPRPRHVIRVSHRTSSSPVAADAGRTEKRDVRSAAVEACPRMPSPPAATFTLPGLPRQ